MARILGRAALSLLLLACLAVAWLFFVWPPPSWWRAHWPAETAYMRLREVQYAVRGDSTPRRYQPVGLDSIADWIESAATAGEDDAFYDHHGIDYRAVREALGYRRGSFSWSDSRDRNELIRALRSSARRGGLRGASTITQQLARNLYLSPSRNPLRKLKEAAIAWRLEWALSKDRILELYLGIVELGPNLWGVEAASRHYFGRSASRVSIEQAALLIATLPHPLTSNPGYRPGRAVRRQQLILRRLRGENVVVPEVEETDSLPQVLPPPPAPESLILPLPPAVPIPSPPGSYPRPTDSVPPDPQSISLSGITRHM